MKLEFVHGWSFEKNIDLMMIRFRMEMILIFMERWFPNLKDPQHRVVISRNDEKDFGHHWFMSLKEHNEISVPVLDWTVNKEIL